MKKFNQARVNGGSNYDSTVCSHGYMRGSSERREKRLLVGSAEPATLSNCGESLKLQLPQPTERDGAHQGNDLGDGNNAEDWVTCSQVLQADAYGCSSTTRRRWVVEGGILLRLKI